MNKQFSLLFILLVIRLVAIAQTTAKDSLLKKLKLAKEDTTAVQLYLDIGDLIDETDALAAKDYYYKAAALSDRINYKRGSIGSYTRYSSHFFGTGAYDSIIFYNEKALAIARETKDSGNIGISLFNIGMARGFMSDFETAIAYCLEGQKIIEGKAHEVMEAQINDKLQILYFQLVQYDKSIGYGEKAVQQARRLKMPSLLAQALTNLSLNYLKKRMPEKAYPLLMEALTIAKKIGNSSFEASILLNLADIALGSGDYETVKLYTERGLLLNRQLGSLEGEVIALGGLARYYLHTKDFTSARKMAAQTLEMAAKYNFREQHVTASKVMSNIAFAAGDMRLGEKYYNQSEDTLVRIVRDLLSERSANLEKKYETEKKETQIKRLEAEQKIHKLSIRQKNILNYILIGSAVILLIISLLSYLNYKQKQKLQQQRIADLEKEKQLAATEAVLKGEEQERTRLAKDLHDGLGGMLSGIKYSFQTMKGSLVMTPDNQQSFERSMDMLDSSIKEMRRVAHNMMPEALVKFGLNIALKDFCNDINRSGALQVSYQSIGIENAVIEQTTAITIYRIVQELINNTMKHAAAKSAIVQVSKTSDAIISITVEDDGKGFDPVIIQEAKGIGWNNIHSRVKYLKGKVDVRSEAGKGTSVLIELNG
jgi:two-component system, NarL family, sensor kinase